MMYGINVWIDLFECAPPKKRIPHGIESTRLNVENAHCKYGSVFDNYDTPLMNLASALVFL